MIADRLYRRLALGVLPLCNLGLLYLLGAHTRLVLAPALGIVLTLDTVVLAVLGAQRGISPGRIIGALVAVAMLTAILVAIAVWIVLSSLDYD